MTLSDIMSIAAALYAGGWRSSDREELIDDFDISDDLADQICEFLEKYES